MSSCNVASKFVGQTVTLEAIPGNGPSGTVYNVNFYKQIGGSNQNIGEYNGTGSQAMVTQPFTTIDIGSVVFYSIVSYTCSDGSVKSVTSPSCTVIVTEECNNPTVEFNVY